MAPKANTETAAKVAPVFGEPLKRGSRGGVAGADPELDALLAGAQDHMAAQGITSVSVTSHGFVSDQSAAGAVNRYIAARGITGIHAAVRSGVFHIVNGDYQPHPRRKRSQ